MNSKRNRIALLFTFTILFILPNWLPASAQSDPTLAGSWVGVYESADHVNLFFVEGNEDGQGYFYTHQSSRPSLIQDLHHDEQQIQFMAGTGDSKLSFAGDRVDDAYVGQVQSEAGDANKGDRVNLLTERISYYDIAKLGDRQRFRGYRLLGIQCAAEMKLVRGWTTSKKARLLEEREPWWPALKMVEFNGRPMGLNASRVGLNGRLNPSPEPTAW